MSAVSSTTTGGLPGPAQMARLPQAIAALTTAPPPVTTSRRMPGCFISWPALSMVGLDTHGDDVGRPPAATIALLSRRNGLHEQRFALGWTLKTTVLPAGDHADGVADDRGGSGWCTGVIAPMTP